MEKERRKIELCAGTSIDGAVAELKMKANELKTACYCSFNGVELTSEDSVDDAYIKVTGKTREENDKEFEKFVEEYTRREEEHKARIPELTERYRKEAVGLVKEDKLEEWNKIVPIRLGDIYQGMEVVQTLDICKIMRDEETDYDTRLHNAYDLFMESGHSGMSAHLTATMIKEFCPHGEDVADAVLNFRFEDKSK